MGDFFGVGETLRLVFLIFFRPFDTDTIAEDDVSTDEWQKLVAVDAAPISLKTIARPAAREPAPFVTRWRSLTVANVDSIGLVSFAAFG